MKILFVCRGNVGRSQMAEALLKRDYPQYEASSAGTKLSGSEQTLESLLPKTKNVIEAMDEENINIRRNIRKQVKEEDLNLFDKIILTGDDRDFIPHFLQNNVKVIKWDVEDPKGKNLEETRNIKNIIKEKIHENFS